MKVEAVTASKLKERGWTPKLIAEFLASLTSLRLILAAAPMRLYLYTKVA